MRSFLCESWDTTPGGVMFAINIRQDRVYRLAKALPLFGDKALSRWLKYSDSGLKGLDINVCNLSTNYCEARLHFSKRTQKGDFTLGLNQLCEWVASACYSYTHHQRLSQQLASWHISIHKPMRNDVVAIARIMYETLGPATTIEVRVLDIEGEAVASARYLLSTNPITR